MTTNNKDFRIKNGLIVDGASATVNGNDVLTTASSINALGDVVITDVATGQVLKWNGTNWINDTDATGTGGGGNSFTTFAVPSGTNPVADSSTDTITFADGANISITGNSTTDTVTVAVDADLTAINGITFNTTPTSPSTDPGTLYWDSGDGILKAIINTNVTVGLGRESIIKVKNATGSTLTKGTVVYINGAQGQMPTVALADADTEPTSSKTFGFLAENITNGSEGYVVTEGVLRGVNTAGFIEGNAIWLSSTAGQYTQTIPAEPAHQVFLGYAVKAHANAGEVIVKIQNGYELTELHGVIIENNGSVVDNEVLAYDTATSLWKNQTASEAGLSVVGHTHSLTDVTDVTASAAEVNILDGATLSTTELNYVDGVTSAIQTQLNGKASTTHTHVSTDITDFTEAAQDAVGGSIGTGLSYNDTTGAISVDTTTIQARVANVSDTEIGYLDGVTSSIQTQINAKANTTDIAELARDAVGTALVAGSNITITPNDAADTITISSSVPAGPTGAQGESSGLQFYWKSAIQDDVPPGYIYASTSSNTVPNSVNQVGILTFNGNDIYNMQLYDFINTWDDSTSTIKGYIHIKSNSNADSDYAIYKVNSVSDYNANSGPYNSVNVTFITGNGIIFSLDERVTVEFYRTGDKGDIGLTGATGPGVPTGGTANQFLSKIDGTNYNTQWTTTLGVANGGTGANTLASGGYLKGAGTSAITSQSGIPGGDITSGTVNILYGGTGGTTGSGLIPIIPSGSPAVAVAGAGSSASVNSTTGTVTYSSATSISLNNIFTSGYTAYRIVFRNTVGNANDSTVSLRVRASGTDYSGALYDNASIAGTSSSSSPVVNNGSGVTSMSLANNYSNGNYMTLDIFNPAQTLMTGIVGNGTSEITAVFRGWTLLGRVRNTTAYDGITFFISAGTMGGTITVYGYKS